MTAVTRRLIRVDDAAASVGVSRNTIYRTIAAGKLELVNIGRASAITMESFDSWIANLPRVAAKHPV